MVVKLKVRLLKYTEFIPWLEREIGPLKHSKPIVEWTGSGWKAYHEGVSEDGPQPAPMMITVDIEDEKKALWFALIWS